MGISTKLLTNSGLTKIHLNFSSSLSPKNRLYFFPNHTTETVAKVQSALDQERLKGRSYEGSLSQLDQEIQVKPYLLKQGNIFKLISKEEACVLQENDIHIPESKCPDQPARLAIRLNDSCPLEITHFMEYISLLGNWPISEELLRRVLQNLYPEESSIDFSSILKKLTEVSQLQSTPSFIQNFPCYQMHPQFQEALYNQLSSVKQQEGYEVIWKVIRSLLNQLIQDQNRYEKGFYYYVERSIFLLNHAQVILNQGQRDEIILLLDQTLHKETSNFSDISPQIQSLESQFLTDGSSYEHARRVLFELRNAYSSLDEHHKLIKCYQKELEIALELNDLKEEGVIYSRLGNAYHLLREFHQAIKYHKSALKIAQQPKNSIGEAIIYSNLGEAYYHLGLNHQAIECHENDLRIVQMAKDPVGLLRAYCHLGNAYCGLGKFSQAIDHHEQALNIAQEFKDRLAEGKTYFNLGMAYQGLGDLRQALAFYEKHLTIAKEFKQLTEEGKVYSKIGGIYHDLGNDFEAIQYHEKHLQMALFIKDKFEEGVAYSGLGNCYSSLGEYLKSRDYHEKHLMIALAMKDQLSEGKAYCNLGGAHYGLGDYLKSMDCHQKHLSIAYQLGNQLQEGQAYGNLGAVYRSLGEYGKSLECHQKELKIAVNLGDLVATATAYSNLGNIYWDLCDYPTAIEYHKKDLEILEKLGNKIKMGKAYINLGNAHLGLRQHKEAVEFYEKSLQIAQEFHDRIGEARSYCNLGNTYHELEELSKAKDYHLKALGIAQELKDKIIERDCYNNVGRVYCDLNEYSEAIKYQHLALIMAEQLKDPVAEGRAYCNLGYYYEKLKQYDKSEEHSYKGINIAASLQKNMKESQWQVTLFERWSLPYTNLERMLLSQDSHIKAVEISDMRRSRVLSSLISKKLSHKEDQDPFLSFYKMRELAKKLQTTFIVYSATPYKDHGVSAQAWIISSQKDMPQFFSLPISQESLMQLDNFDEIFPYKQDSARPKRGEKQPYQVFKENLSLWHDILINPLKSHLPSPHAEETLTFIPDRQLAHLPFGIFYDQSKGKYLIQEYAISIAPSIQVLSLLDKLPKTFSNQALLLGNPTIPPNPLEKLAELKQAEREVGKVDKVIKKLIVTEKIEAKILTKTDATVKSVIEHAPQARYIHFTCHGILGKTPPEDPHSVFDGLFKLAPDEGYPLGNLHSKEINSLSLKTDLVFMSACHLGRGNVQKEGSIGPIWSFLGSGALSTIASYWPLPDDPTTVNIVKLFYQHYLGSKTPKLSKVKALQKAVIQAIEDKPNNLHQWGAFFLSGLTE
ncbi:hypothetical protein RSOCI_03855 [Rhabdochlamydiaceae symbiont of Dictyostelium giganteum]